ncbi:MAG: histone deacetylase family protein [Actinobacteria bacterium]|nr:histone deacetylase family protein [Actinomycetota bacterium]
MIRIIRSPRARDHVPGAEIWLGMRTPGTEVPERVDAIEAAIEDWPTMEALPHDDEVLLRVHDARLVEHLHTVWDRWGEYGADRVVPYLFPTAGLLGDLPERQPVAPHAAAGRYCYDTMTLVGPGTWEGARAAVDVALTCVDVVGDGVVYGLTRPPGHHVTRAAYGGSCYLNNAAVAAEALRRAGHERVAIVDIDAHHGNGTQDIFYGRGDVFYGSLHVDPGAGWFPHYAGFADEVGIDDGAGANVNIPLAPGAGDEAWLDGLRRLADAVSTFGATALVFSLGVDAAADDPESPLQVSVDGYDEAGRILGELRLPTVALQEGGYHLPTLGSLVRATLEGLEA